MKKLLKGCLIVLGVVFALLIAVAMFAGGSGDSDADKGASSPTPISQEADDTSDEAAPDEEASAEEGAPAEKPAKYEITNESVEQDDWSLKITGVLTNNSGHDRSYVQVEYSLYDADGNLIGSAYDNVNNLKDGGSWKFSATAFLTSDQIAEVDSYELADISAW